jgi:hypothetical protein
VLGAVACSVSTQYGIKGVVDALGKGPESGLIWPGDSETRRPRACRHTRRGHPS